MADQGAFEKSTLHRLCVEAARFWVIDNYLADKKLPDSVTFFAYPRSQDGMNWGDDDSGTGPLHGKRVRVTLEVENQS